MAYDVANPPYLISQGIGGKGKQWRYDSDDDLATVNTDGYFTNGYDLGLRVGDTVQIFEKDTGKLSVSVVVSASTSGVDLGDGSDQSSGDAD